MRTETVATPAEAGSEQGTLAEIEAYTGVVADQTGDYETGRTVFHANSEDFLDFLASRMHKSE